jgi:mRNA interferase MazF
MYKKGTVVLVPFPFTDLTGNKVRPAIIISENKIGNDIVVVFITSQTKLKEKHQVTITPNPHNGLKISSRALCAKIATLETKIVLGELGVVSDSVKQKIDTELRAVFGI